MEVLKEIKSDATQPVPLIGVESYPMLSNESTMAYGDMSGEQFSRTSECAYYKAEARGFDPGHDMEDWLSAEEELKQ